VFVNDGEGTYHRIIGAIAIYLNIALIFALLYRLALFIDPHALTVSSPGGSRELSPTIDLAKLVVRYLT
jgi:hypothetical protein